MPSHIHSFDVAVIGAGIAGCHLAQILANNQLKVALIDRRPLKESGPHWINAVPLWMFDEAKLIRPSGEELFDINDRFFIRAPDKHNRLTINDLGVADVNMSLLGARLKEKFLGSNGYGQFFLASINGSIYDDNNRLMEIRGHTENQGPLRIRAKLFVDSSGYKAILRKAHPWAEKLWRKVSYKDTCTAAQRTLEIKDRHGAESFLENNKFEPGDVLSDIGFAGGYSLFRSQIGKNLSHISLLCGIRALPEYPGAHSVITKFVSENKWIGTHFIDGRGAIPINAPYRSLVAPGLALLGDSACQVYAAHGSGIGVGLIAAKTLADAVISAHVSDQDIGEMRSLVNYQVEFHRKFYRRLYFSEHFRKFSQDLDQNRTISLIKSGLLTANLAKQTLEQNEPGLGKGSLKLLISGAVKSPKLFASLIPVFGKATFGNFHVLRLSILYNTPHIHNISKNPTLFR